MRRRIDGDLAITAQLGEHLASIFGTHVELTCKIEIFEYARFLWWLLFLFFSSNGFSNLSEVKRCGRSSLCWCLAWCASTHCRSLWKGKRRMREGREVENVLLDRKFRLVGCPSRIHCWKWQNRYSIDLVACSCDAGRRFVTWTCLCFQPSAKCKVMH